MTLPIQARIIRVQATSFDGSTPATATLQAPDAEGIETLAQNGPLGRISLSSTIRVPFGCTVSACTNNTTDPSAKIQFSVFGPLSAGWPLRTDLSFPMVVPPGGNIHLTGTFTSAMLIVVPLSRVTMETLLNEALVNLSFPPQNFRIVIPVAGAGALTPPPAGTTEVIYENNNAAPLAVNLPDLDVTVEVYVTNPGGQLTIAPPGGHLINGAPSVVAASNAAVLIKRVSGTGWLAVGV